VRLEDELMREALEAVRAAAAAGAQVLRDRRGEVGAVRAKRWTNDLVSEVDIAAGVAVVREILRWDENANVLIEEDEVYDLTGTVAGNVHSGSVWIIDPLDGTTSFVHGYPCYSVSVAYAENGVVVAGAVHNAAMNELFSAGRGLGADVDGASISVTGARGVREALLVTGFPYDRGDPLELQLRVFSAFLRGYAHGIRRDGSAANDCCHVAMGRADGYWEYYLKPWDMAAGALICEEAGARVTDVSGSPWTVDSESIVVANAKLHAEMLEVIRSAGAAVRAAE
jgi:myo-inositol-1(or 4)-monophosphatase